MENIPNQQNQPNQNQSIQPEQNPPVTNQVQPPNQTNFQQTQPINQNQPQQSSDTGRTILAVILLLFLPVIGVILMWFITGWSSTVKILITILYVVLILPTIILSIIVISSLHSSVNQKDDAMAISNLKATEGYLFLYRSKNNKYPITNSYANMSLKLEEVSSSVPEGYHLKYCSSSGKEYKLEIGKLSTNQPYSLGSDTCQPGE